MLVVKIRCEYGFGLSQTFKLQNPVYCSSPSLPLAGLENLVAPMSFLLLVLLWTAICPLELRVALRCAVLPSGVLPSVESDFPPCGLCAGAVCFPDAHVVKLVVLACWLSLVNSL